MGSGANQLASGAPFDILPGLVGWWQMEGGLTDSAPPANSAAGVDSPSYDTGKIGQALALDGTSQYGSVADDPSLDITDAITIAAWIKPDAAGTQYLVKKAVNGSASGNGYVLGLASLSSTGRVFFRLNQQASGNTYRIDSDTDYPYDGNTWIHVAATYDGAAIRIYYNEVEDALSEAGPVSITANDLPLAIGADSDGASLYQGLIDDVRVYSRALSDTEIEALFLSRGRPDHHLRPGAHGRRHRGSSVSASASSGLPVTYSSTTTGICTVDAASGELTLLAAGTCTVAADQAGDADWNPAPQATQDVDVAPPATHTVSGTLTPGDAGGVVWAFKASDGSYAGGVLVAGDGSYSFDLAPDSYKLWITDVAGYPDQAYGPDGTFANATVVDLTSADQPGTDITLAAPPATHTVSGTLTPATRAAWCGRSRRATARTPGACWSRVTARTASTSPSTATSCGSPTWRATPTRPTAPTARSPTPPWST